MISNLTSDDFFELNSTDPILENFIKLYPINLWRNNGFFEDSYLLLINKHWLQFSPPSPARHYLLAVLYIIIMSIGVFGNCLVIIMLLRCRSLRTPANILVMNLAVSDFFMIAKMPIFIYNSFKQGPALGKLGCQIYGFLGGLTGTVSISTLAAIAIDRYFVIIYPLDPLKRTTRLRAGICVLISWLYAAVFSSLPLLGINHYVPEGYLTSCGFDYLSVEFSSRIFIIVFFVAAWVVPFIIITFSYVNICLMVVSARQGGARNATGFREQQKKTELKLTIVVIGIIGLWFFAWTPYATIALLGFSGQRHLIMPLTSMIPALFCKIASCIDPFVYAVSHPRFRRELIRCFSRKAYANTEKLYKSKATTAMAGIEVRRAIQRDLLSDASNTEEDNENMMMVDLQFHNGCKPLAKKPLRRSNKSFNNIWLTTSSDPHKNDPRPVVSF